MKRILCLFFSFVMLFGLCACGDVTTQSTEPNSTQANITTTPGTESTTAPIKEATESATEAATVPTTEATTEPETEPTTEATIATNAESQAKMVWIPTKGGTKHHTKASCSNMIDPEQVTQAEAESRGFTPCKKCH